MSNISLKCKHTPSQSVFLRPLFPSVSPLFSLILSQLYRCLRLSPCCREGTEHPSSSGGEEWWWWWGVQAPRFALLKNTRSSGLEGRQSTGDQTLALGPAAGFHSSLPSPADLGHFHVGQQQAAFSLFFFFLGGVLIFFFCLRVSNLLFILVRMPLMSREGDIGEEIEGRNMSVSDITAQPLWPKVDVCPSDLWGLNQQDKPCRQFYSSSRAWNWNMLQLL